MYLLVLLPLVSNPSFKDTLGNGGRGGYGAGVVSLGKLLLLNSRDCEARAIKYIKA